MAQPSGLLKGNHTEMQAGLRGLGHWREGVTVVWEWFPACHDKCSSCHHTATAKSGAKSKVISLGRACQKSCFKIPQFPCVAQEILWVITHNAQLGAGYSCSQLLPNSFFLCVTLLWSRVVLALQRASKELLLLETQGRGRSSSGGREPWQSSTTQQGTAQRSLVGDHCQLQEPAHTTPRGRGRY